MEEKEETNIFHKLKSNPSYTSLSLLKNPILYGIVSIISLVVILLILYKWNVFNISSKYPVFSGLFILLIVFFQVMTFLFVSEQTETDDNKRIFPKSTFQDVILKLIFTVILISFFVLFVYASIWVIETFPTSKTIFIYILNFLILIVLSAIIYAVLIPMIKNNSEIQNEGSSSDIIKLIKELFFYIPCAIIDVVDWFRNQYNITTKPVLILLSIEIILISLRILVPKIVKTAINKDSIQVLKEPIYLNNSRLLKSYDELYDKDDKIKKYVYSISAWFWINPQPPSTNKSYSTYTNIIEYGRQPAVEYNSMENKLRVNCLIENNEEKTIAEIKNINLQTWNYIVINYDGSTMDVFLNGELIGSKPNIAPYIVESKNIVVGSEKGIEGGICNVMFNKKIMNKQQIITTYKFLKELETPFVI